MGNYRLKSEVVEARQVTQLSLEAVELWCGGDIQGIKLDRRFQAIRTEQDEVAEIGDYIVKQGDFFKVFTQPEFHNLFEETRC